MYAFYLSVILNFIPGVGEWMVFILFSGILFEKRESDVSKVKTLFQKSERNIQKVETFLSKKQTNIQKEESKIQLYEPKM